MKPDSFFDYITTTQQFLLEKRQRRMLVLKGDKTWAKNLLKQLPSFLVPSEQLPEKNTEQAANKQSKWLLFSAPLTANHLIINGKNYRHYLGTECDYLLFDGEHFNVDAFAALSGTIKAGGLLFLLWPQNLSEKYNEAKNLFLQRFYQQLVNDDNVIIVVPSTFSQEPAYNWQLIKHNSLPTKTTVIVATPPKLAYGCATEEQLLAVEAIKKVFSGHRNRPLVLTADRGRGKSSALAIACANIIQQAKQAINITVTAPHQQALNVFFQQLKESLPQAHYEKHQLVYNQQKCRVGLTFIPVDKLVHDDINTHFLLVDEAGAIPVYLLTKLLQRYHRIVFSTTLHGYEGAGRGFTLKFLQHLQRIRPEFNSLHIKQPIRWADDDPLEQFVFNSCLLNAELSTFTNKKDFDIAKQSYHFQHINRTTLACNETLLRQVFSILVTAHYQTSPSDLALMLDNPNVAIVALRQHEQIVAVALLITEGHCTSADIKAIETGKRRLKDQFTPQSLLNHCGFAHAFDFSYLRIMRIAVHPSLQQQGIGRYFLQQITAFAQAQQVDFLATSFGATTALLNFWLTDNYRVARVGFTKDQASGEHSILLLKALNKRSQSFQSTIQRKFYRSFSYLLTDEYQWLSTAVATVILRYYPKEQTETLSDDDQQAIIAFANKTQLYATSVYSLHLALLRYLALNNNMDKQGILPVVARVLQKQPVSVLCKQYGFTGKKAFNQYLVDFTNTHLKRLP